VPLQQAPHVCASTSEVSLHAPERVGRARLTAVITSAMTVGTVTPFALSALAPFVVPELTLSRTQYGSLITIYFLVGAVASPAVGRLVDAAGGWRMMIVLFGLGTLALAVMAQAVDYAWLVAAMVVAGLANALSNPATNTVVGTHAPAGRRGVLVGVKQSGVQIGATASGLLLPTGAVALGWRPSLAVGGAVAAACGVAAVLLRPRRRSAPATPRPPGPAARGRLDTGWLVAYAFFMGAGVAVVNGYIVLYAHEELLLSAGRAGAALGVLGLVAVVARIVLARSAESRASTVTILFVLGIVATVSSAALVLAPVAGGEPLLWLAVLGLGMSASAWNSVGMLAIIADTGAGATGRASGLVLSGFFAGHLVSPVAFGAVVDRTDGYGAGWVIVTVTFLVPIGIAHGRRRRIEGTSSSSLAS
jgi:predicted MFS family arabinose efflux permease